MRFLPDAIACAVLLVLVFGLLAFVHRKEIRRWIEDLLVAAEVGAQS